MRIGLSGPDDQDFRTLLQCAAGKLHHLEIFDSGLEESIDALTALDAVFLCYPEFHPEIADVVGHLRLRSTRILIVAAAGAAGEDAFVEAFDRGADECLRLPIGIRELAQRIAALRRRLSPGGRAKALRVGNAHLDTDRRLLQIDGKTAPLSPLQFCLCELLMRNAGGLVQPELILEEVWHQYTRGADTSQVKYNILQLRRALQRHGASFDIITVPHLGYRIELRAEQWAGA